MVALHREELSSIYICCRWTEFLVSLSTTIYRVELDMLFFFPFFVLTWAKLPYILSVEIKRLRKYPSSTVSSSPSL